MEDVFIQYGCKQLETPILNYKELLASKYGGGAEILEEMYTLTDRGKRDLALRYDLTIPFTKVVALNPTLPMPFKRYEIGKVFRDGPVKTGRLREFTQCDVDIVGVDSQIAEAELMNMALDAFRKIDLKVTIQYNNRKLLTGMLEVFGSGTNNINKALLTLDKLEKVGLESVIRELNEKGLSKETVSLIKQFLTDTNNTNFRYYENYAKQNDKVRQGLNELKELKFYLDYLNISESCLFNPLLARGLEIYTGTIYEIFLADNLITSSIGSGGRYNNVIGGLIGTNDIISTVGVSFGLDVIYTALRLTKNSKEISITDYYVVPLGTAKEALIVANNLRSKGYKVELELGNKKLGKALKKANKEKIRFVVILGEEEISKNKIRIKDMLSSNEKLEPFQFR